MLKRFIVAAIATASVGLVAMASGPTPQETAPVWTVTGGPTTGTKPFPSGTVTSVLWTGKINPPLGSGVTGSIGSVTIVCAGNDETVAARDVMGGAQGASFTIDVKQSAVTGKCSKVLRVCFELSSGGEECVTLAIPAMLNTPTIDYGTFGQLPAYEVELAVKVVDRFGAINASYNGEVVIVAQSDGGGVKLDGTWGQAVVTIVDGVGTFDVDASTVPPGGLVMFDLSAQRTDPYRSSIERQ